MKRLFVTLSLMTLLAAGCTLPVRHGATDALLQAQSEREAFWYDNQHWGLTARMGLSDGEQVGSGSLSWAQTDDLLALDVRAAVTGHTYQLCADANHAILFGAGKAPITSDSLDALTRRIFGWQVPVDALQDWVRGLRARASVEQAVLHFGDDERPSLLEQDDWKVEYRKWSEDIQPPLPTKIYASHGDKSVRLSVHQWWLQDDAAAYAQLVQRCSGAL